MRTFDFTNGKQFPETLHVSKSVPYDYRHIKNMMRDWNLSLYLFARSFQNQQVDRSRCRALDDFVEFVINRVPVYFVNKDQIGNVIEVQETAYYSVYETIVPDNHITVPLISVKEMGRAFGDWERAFKEHIEGCAEDNYRYPKCYPSDYEIIPELENFNESTIEIEAEALYRSTSDDSEDSYPEIFVYMDYFVDKYGRATRPTAYLAYVLAHELTHAMMDEKLWEAFLCKNGKKLTKGIPHNSKRYYLFEEGLATAVGWNYSGLNEEVAMEIMKVGLPYCFGLSPYYYFPQRSLSGRIIKGTRFRSLRIPEWLSQKIDDPTPYL